MRRRLTVLLAMAVMLAMMVAMAMPVLAKDQLRFYDCGQRIAQSKVQAKYSEKVLNIECTRLK